jgi:hypothetical protein
VLLIGDIVKVYKVLAINLTTIFGAGKEPTALQMDNLLAKFPNSWFNGTAEIVNTNDLMFYKASTTQESFIAPTLVNSFANFGGTDAICGYFKDALGIVHLRGKIKTGASGASPFTLPVGYRPPLDIIFPIVSNGAFGTCNITSAGFVTVTGNATFYSLAGITFRSA